MGKKRIIINYEQSIKHISQIIINYYNALMYSVLIELTNSNLSNTIRFINIIRTLKILIDLEKKIYSLLPDRELLKILKKLDEEQQTEAAERCKKRLKIINKSHKGIDNRKTEIFEASLIINALSLVKTRLDNLPRNEKYILLIYFESIKIKYLTSNPLLEKLALKFNFDLLKIQEEIPTLNHILKNSNTNFFLEIIDLYNRLAKGPENSNAFLNTVIGSINIVQIELLLVYLDKNSLLKLKKYIEINISNNKPISIVRKLVFKAYIRYEQQ